MPKTLKDFWILFRLPKGAFLCSVMLFLSGLIAGYFYANLRYETQTHGVDSNYVFEYLIERGVPVMPVDNTGFRGMVRTNMGDAVLTVQPGLVQVVRIYEYEFSPSCEITKLQLLEAVNSAKLGGLGGMALLSFSGTKAAVFVSFQSYISKLQFQRNWSSFLMKLDLNDQTLDRELKALAGEGSVRRTLVAPTEYGRIFNNMHDVRNYDPRAAKGMLDIMQQ